MGQVLGIAAKTVTFLPFALSVPSFTSCLLIMVLRIAGRELLLRPEGDFIDLLEEGGN